MQSTSKGPFKVTVARMVESCGTSYMVVLDNADRTPETSFMDSIGRITPMQHANLDYVAQEAREWAEFLGAPAEELEVAIAKLYAEAPPAATY